MTKPIVSIVLPSYNRLQFLRPAVESVFAQTFSEWELIVADDGSDADTRAFLQSLRDPSRVKLLLLPHSGNPGTMRNAALRIAAGRYVAFQDSDDLWLPNKLLVQLNAMESNPSRRWSYTAFHRIDEFGNVVFDKGIKQWVPHQGAVFKELLKMDAIVAMPTVIAERSLIAEVGGFDEEQTQHGDYELWLRLSLRSAVLLIDEPLACVRRHREHYTSGGLRALTCKRRLYDKMHGEVTDSELRSAVTTQRAINAAQLARAFAASGQRSEALQIVRDSYKFSWPYRYWWQGAVVALLAQITPNWLVARCRRWRRQWLSIRTPTA